MELAPTTEITQVPSSGKVGGAGIHECNVSELAQAFTTKQSSAIISQIDSYIHKMTRSGSVDDKLTLHNFFRSLLVQPPFCYISHFWRIYFMHAIKAKRERNLRESTASGVADTSNTITEAPLETEFENSVLQLCCWDIAKMYLDYLRDCYNLFDLTGSLMNTPKDQVVELLSHLEVVIQAVGCTVDSYQLWEAFLSGLIAVERFEDAICVLEYLHSVPILEKSSVSTLLALPILQNITEESMKQRLSVMVDGDTIIDGNQLLQRRLFGNKISTFRLKKLESQSSLKEQYDLYIEEISRLAKIEDALPVNLKARLSCWGVDMAGYMCRELISVLLQHSAVSSYLVPEALDAYIARLTALFKKDHESRLLCNEMVRVRDLVSSKLDNPSFGCNTLAWTCVVKLEENIYGDIIKRSQSDALAAAKKVLHSAFTKHDWKAFPPPTLTSALGKIEFLLSSQEPSKGVQAVRLVYQEAIDKWKAKDDYSTELLSLYESWANFVIQLRQFKSARQIFEDGLSDFRINKQPRLWRSYLKYSIDRRKIKQTRNLFARALGSVESEQDDIWNDFLSFEQANGLPSLTLPELKQMVESRNTTPKSQNQRGWWPSSRSILEKAKSMNIATSEATSLKANNSTPFPHGSEVSQTDTISQTTLVNKNQNNTNTQHNKPGATKRISPDTNTAVVNQPEGMALPSIDEQQDTTMKDQPTETHDFSSPSGGFEYRLDDGNVLGEAEAEREDANHRRAVSYDEISMDDVPSVKDEAMPDRRNGTKRSHDDTNGSSNDRFEFTVWRPSDTDGTPPTKKQKTKQTGKVITTIGDLYSSVGADIPSPVLKKPKQQKKKKPQPPVPKKPKQQKKKKSPVVKSPVKEKRSKTGAQIFPRPKKHNTNRPAQHDEGFSLDKRFVSALFPQGAEDNTEGKRLDINERSELEQIQSMLLRKKKSQGHNSQQRVVNQKVDLSQPLDLVSQLTEVFEDETILQIVEHLENLQRMKEQDIADRRIALIKDCDLKQQQLEQSHTMFLANAPHNQVNFVRQNTANEKQRFIESVRQQLHAFDMDAQRQLDEATHQQQEVLQQAGILGFFPTHDPQQIALQAQILALIVNTIRTKREGKPRPSIPTAQSVGPLVQTIPQPVMQPNNVDAFSQIAQLLANNNIVTAPHPPKVSHIPQQVQQPPTMQMNHMGQQQGIPQMSSQSVQQIMSQLMPLVQQQPLQSNIQVPPPIQQHSQHRHNYSNQNVGYNNYQQQHPQPLQHQQMPSIDMQTSQLLQQINSTLAGQQQPQQFMNGGGFHQQYNNGHHNHNNPNNNGYF